MRLCGNPLAALALVAVLNLVILGCDKSVRVYDDKTVWVSDLVIDSVTRAPVDSAWVSGVAEPTMPSIFTDSLGAFLFSHWPFGHDPLFAGKRGYITGRLLIRDSQSDVRGLLFELVKTEGSK